MMKGAYEAEYYELSLVDVRFEMDRLRLGGKGGVWEGLDEGNVRYVGRMSEGMRGMRVIEFKIEVLSEYLKGKGGVEGGHAGFGGGGRNSRG